MRALVVGYGSIGARHARILSGEGLEVAIVSARETDEFPRFKAMQEAIAEWMPDYTVIASATADHHGHFAALGAADYRGRVLVEKPLFGDRLPVPENRFNAVAVGFNLRFHGLLRRLKERLADERLLAFRAQVGQYLPDWRPGRDYRTVYSAGRGGGVLRDLCHEIDIAAWLCGGWRRLTAIGGRFGDLEIDSDDLFMILGECERCPAVSIQMSYLDRPARRQIDVVTDRGSWRADLIAGTLDGRGGTESLPGERDETYRQMHRSLLDDDGEGCRLADGLAVDAVIAAAERAARERSWEAL